MKSTIVFIMLLAFPFFANASCEDEIELMSDGASIKKALKCLNDLSKDKSDVIAKGMIAYFNKTECPKGWQEFKKGHGFYIVGVGSEDSISSRIGVKLEDNENRSISKHTHQAQEAGEHIHGLSPSGSHSHTLNRTDQAPKNDGVNVDWRYMGSPNTKGTVNALSNAPNHTHNISSSGGHSHSLSVVGSVEGTNAPYIQLLSCEKK